MTVYDSKVKPAPYHRTEPPAQALKMVPKPEKHDPVTNL